MKYYVYYVENCTSKLKAFKTKKAQNNFISSFKIDEDNRIDLVFEGNVTYKESYLSYDLNKYK